MQVLRITHLYLLKRNVYYPEYIVCSSYYKSDKYDKNKLRTLFDKHYSCSEEKLKWIDGQQELHNRILYTPARTAFSMTDVTGQVLSFFRDIRMEDMTKAPTPVFWYSAAALVPLLGVPLSSLIFGYSPYLASAQLAFGATLCSFAGGMKWGYALHGTEHQPTWENLGWTIVPKLIGCLGLLMPQSLGYLLVTAGLALSAFVDLTTTNYPNWFKSIRLAVTVPALFSFLFMFLLRVFH